MGSFNIIETREDLSIWGQQSLISHMIINAVEQGNHCVYLPCWGWNENRLRKHLRPFLDEEKYERYVTVFELHPGKERYDVGDNVIGLQGASIEEDLGVIRDHTAKLKPPVLTIIGADMLEHPYQLVERGELGAMVRKLFYRIADTRIEGNVDVLGVTPNLR